MPKRFLGIKKIEFSELAPDGDVGTSWQEIGDTVINSASLVTEEGTITDLFTEESDDPIESIESQKGATRFNMATHNLEAATMAMFFGGTTTPAYIDGVLTVGAITGGTSYTNGLYLNVPLTGGSGSGAKADITVSGGAVTAIAIVDKGNNYEVGDDLSASNTNLGGTGSGFEFAVAAIGSSGGEWEAPDNIEPKELSVRITDKKNNVVRIVRSSVQPRLNAALNKTALAQVDLVATVLKPTKNGVKKYKFTYAA